MIKIKVIKPLKWGSGKFEGIWEQQDGKHFCGECRKMLRVGEVIIESLSPAFRRRATHYSYYHKECVNVEDRSI